MCLLAPVLHAELWTLDKSLEITVGANDNYQLSFAPSARVETLALTGALGASRQTETSATHVDGGLTGFALHGEPGQNHLEGHVNLSQSLDGPLDSVEFGLNLLQDTTYDTIVNSTDLLLGRGQRHNRGLSLAWTHRFAERLSSSITAQAAQTRYSQQVANAIDFQNNAYAATLQYLLDERDRLNARLGHSDYRALDGSARSVTDDIGMGWQRSLSEKGTVSVNLGRYRTRTTALEPVLACPLPANFCSSGLVNYIVVERPGNSTRWGLQYSAAYNHQFDEVTNLGFSAARQQAPSGAGVVVRSDTLEATVGRAFSPTLNGNLSYGRSRSVFQGVILGPQPKLLTLNVSLSKALSPELSLRSAYQFSRSDEPVSGQAAHSNSLAVTLRYEWPRVEARR